MQTVLSISRKLEVRGDLEKSDVDDLESICGKVRDLPRRSLLSSYGAGPSVFPVLLEGWAVRQKIMRTGTRQITRVMLPGDYGYYDGATSVESSEEIMTLSSSKVAFVDFSRFEQFLSSNPRVSQAMCRLACEESARITNAVVRLGRLNALERMADFICETYDRLRSVDLITDARFSFPLTQDDLADVLGLTPVHVNRKLQDLRRRGLITLKRRDLTIRDLRSLQAIAGYDAREEDRPLGSDFKQPAFAG